MLLPEQKEIEYILNHLDDPEALQEESFREWLDEANHRELFEKIRNYREAFLRQEGEGTLDVDEEWRRFEVKISKNRKGYIREIGAVAASILIFLMVGILWQLAEQEMVKVEYETELVGKKSAELILASGQRINLEEQAVEFQEKNGIHVTNTTNSCLAYQLDTVTSLADTTQELIYNTVKIPAGADYKIYLADGTGIWVNCGSELRYPVKFTGRERRVYLDGEAFFEVKKAENWPFIVETERMHIQVTGTRFNVKSYTSEDIVQTTLVNGAVTVHESDDLEHVVQLLPAQQYSLNKRSGQIDVKVVDTHLYTDWTEGMFVFKKQRLEDVMNTLSRWYNIEVFYTNPSLKDLRLSANLGRYEHIDTILNMIQAIDKVVVVRKENVITFSWK